MQLLLFVQAAFLGLLEGLTEFIPVSSTGHLILAVDLIGFRGPPGQVFEVAIQLGAILAICWLYRVKLFAVAFGLWTQPDERRFAIVVLLGFLPAIVLGVAFYSFIKAVLFSPWVVAVSLIAGGIAILVIEAWRRAPVHDAIERLPFATALAIGFAQALAMIPGVSRSGATIMGGLVLGVERRTATEFSFFLAIPTMFAATLYDLYKNRAGLTLDNGVLIAVGFVTAFIAAMVVVRWLVGFVGRRGFAPFAWYRIAIGAVMLAILALR